MERVSKKAIATSRPFKFRIGRYETDYTIHLDLVAHHSPLLAAGASGDFICLAVDEIVFNSFWQFVYTGDYDTPEPLPSTRRTSGRGEQKSDDADKPAEKEPKAEAEAVEAVKEETDEAEVSAVEQGKRGSVQKSLLWDHFRRSWECPREVIDIDKSLKDQTNRLVHHAKVFTLADDYEFKRLAEISRGKLYDDLIDLERKGGDFENVVELVRYTFEEPVPDQLTNMVIDFSACVVERLWKFEEFQELLEKHGILSKALVGKLLDRLAESPSRLCYD
ncbi:hypothetical protein FOXYS1_10337 [Fusarium oxysporum]|uniref:BTB domain-containing protein n=1 Tax=Fusarium oxysporum TaxID=5507 RepID=A0A8H5A549_FUSOX|nr:hypothetical protein FOXYS1_10337 [Fusarium oxysporum]